MFFFSLLITSFSLTRRTLLRVEDGCDGDAEMQEVGRVLIGKDGCTQQETWEDKRGEVADAHRLAERTKKRLNYWGARGMVRNKQQLAG